MATRWSSGIGARFVYDFPLISEIVAIVWTSMCLIFQTGNKKTSYVLHGTLFCQYTTHCYSLFHTRILPKPWRIVVPSIVIFTLMSLGSVAYAILTNGYIKRLCSNLRQGLTNPQGVRYVGRIVLYGLRLIPYSISSAAAMP